ncbi:MAG: amino acid ABC transporter permease [Acidimicrobiia bacterium]|nr:amino acid ABC transporter permease [Acidimicrobiia bacterium]
MTDHIVTENVEELAPEPPPRGPIVWMRQNLFYSVFSTILTVVFGLIGLFAARGLMTFMFADDRRWDAVTKNMRLMMAQAYPAGDNPTLTDEAGVPIDQFHRIWLTVAFVAVLLALTFAIFRIGGRIAPRMVGRILMGVGIAAIGGGILGPFSTAAKSIWIIGGLAVLGIGYYLANGLGERGKQETVSVNGLIGLGLGLVVVVLWILQVPFPVRPESGEAPDLIPTAPGQFIEYQDVASSTVVPWTLIIIAIFVAYWIGVLLRERVPGLVDLLKKVIIGLWIAAYPFLTLVVLRDPAINYDKVWPWYILLGLFFVVGGGLLLNFLASKTAGEAGRAIAALLVVVSVASFFVSTEYVVRFLLMSLALFALAAPTFGGEGASRTRFLVGWASWVVLLIYLVTLTTTESTVEVPGNFFIGGLFLTFIIAITGIVASFPIGVVLALARTSTMPIFRIMSTAYIELVRGVPLITWLLVAFLMLPVALPEGVELGGVVRAIIMIAFFSAAYLAENVRGGLQAISKGQYEAAQAVGLTTVQMTVFITLPQALRAVIPALVGQIIALFKDTSLVTIVGLFDILHIARQVIPAQTQPFNFLGSIKETLIFTAVVYWIFTFTFSRISLRLEKRLGVGER